MHLPIVAARRHHGDPHVLDQLEHHVLGLLVGPAFHRAVSLKMVHAAVIDGARLRFRASAETSQAARIAGQGWQKATRGDNQPQREIWHGQDDHAEGQGRFRTGGLSRRAGGDAKAGLVVAQEIFGLNHHIRSVADRFAAEGYW